MKMEEKLVINELEQGKELATQLLTNLQHSSSPHSNQTLISEILRIYQNAIFVLGFDDDDKNILKRSPEINDEESRNVLKKRKIAEKVRVFVGTEEEEKDSIDDGYCWRKYGQKQIHGSKNRRGYFRCSHRFTQNCLAVKQVQKSDTDPFIFKVKYLGDHTCNYTSPKTTTVEEGNRAHVTEQREDIIKSEETIISLEDLENKNNIFETFSFSNDETENVWMESNINLMGKVTPATSGSGITNEIVTAPASVWNSETADSFFSSLDNITDFGEDWLWS